MTIISDSPKTNQEAIPLISGDVFSNNPDARFAIAVFDGHDVVSDEPTDLVQAYLRLRANVYIDQIGVLDDEHRRSDGAEIDEDDERSTHFALLENIFGQIAVFGCLRFIEKSDEHNAELPIESFFPDSFKEPVESGGVEVSRFIVRHNEARQRGRAKLNLIRTGSAYLLRNNFGPIHATIETEFERDLRSVGVPTEKITEPKFIEEYNTSNHGVRFDSEGLRKLIGDKAVYDLAIDKGDTGVFFGKVEKADEDLRIA
jgi:N-acyl-L-homoserine lactone synthetase